jgi:nucleotide-binding universal stress UspA family protein
MNPYLEPSPQPVLRRRVLVALPPVGSAEGAIQAGRVLARAMEAPLHGVLVWPTPIAPSEVPRLLRCDPAVLDGMVIDVAVGDPAERLHALATAQPVAFMVLTAEDGGHDPCGLGDVAARAIAASTTGALLMRPGASLAGLSRILVPLDGTPSTAAALGPATDLAKRAGATLDIVLIEDIHAPLPAEPGAMAPPKYIDQPQHEWPAFSTEFVQRFMGSIAHCPGGVPKRFFVASGHPASEILRFARELDTDLIALVWHGGCSDDHGACFREIVRGARRPVLVLRR